MLKNKRSFNLFKYGLLLICLNVFLQTKSNNFCFPSEKISNALPVAKNKILLNNSQNQTQSSNTYIFTLIEKQLLVLDEQTIMQLHLEKKQDTTNKTALKAKMKAKMEAERWRCKQPDPKMIEAKKAAEEKFKNKN